MTKTHVSPDVERALLIEASLETARRHMMEVSHALNNAVGLASLDYENIDDSLRTVQGAAQLTFQGIIREHGAWMGYAAARASH